MTRLGIILAVSDYTGDADNLPACHRDAEAMSKILSPENGFDDVLIIRKDTVSSSVKLRLTEFCRKHHNQPIDEVVFYFTGHGDFVNDEFYYLLSDYKSKHPKSTSLENSELDNLIRGLSPSLFVKIVDACHSGMAYIKSPDDFGEHIKSANGKFSKLYFMFSCQSDQTSIQNSNLSYFTESIVKAVINNSDGPIRYKDVIDQTSDYFDLHDYQKPLFVTQADFTEVFCDVSQPLRDALKEYSEDDESISLDHSKEPEKTVSLVDRIKRDAVLYVSEEEAIAVLRSLSSRIQQWTFSGVLAELFSFELVEEQDQPVPSPDTIGKWLSQKGIEDRGYFAEPTTEEREFERRITVDPFGINSIRHSLWYTNDPYRVVKETRSVIAGFRHTMSMPYDHLIGRARPDLPNLTPADCFIVPILSRTHLRLFWGNTAYEYVSWTKTKRVGKFDWSTDEVLLREPHQIDGIIDKIMASFASFVEMPIQAKWSPSSDELSVDRQSTSE